MTTALDLKREARLARVLELLASGEASSITKACELAEVPRSTFYDLLKTGSFDELLATMKAANVAEVVSHFTDALPKLLKRVLADALNENEEEKLTARDRDQAARTALLLYNKLTGGVAEPATGESAGEWLKRQGKSFQPVQIIGTQVIVQSPPSEGEVVEGSAVELD